MSRFAPEEELLLRCLRCFVSREPLELPPGTDWQKLIVLASQHHMVPILQATISKGSLPEGFHSQVQKRSRRSKMRAALMVENYETAHQCLTNAGIDVMPIKGIILAQTIYPSLAQRYFDDVDILVRPEAAQTAFDVLREAGYALHPRAVKPDWHHLPPLIHPRYGAMLEIHFDVVRRFRPGWSVDDIWRRAEFTVVGNLRTWSISKEDSLILTALHARHNLYSRLSYVLDNALLQREMLEDERFPENVTRLAEQAGARCALGQLQSMSRQMLKLDSLPKLPCNKASAWLVGKAFGWRGLSENRNALRRGPVATLAEVMLVDSLADGLRLVGKVASPPAEFVRQGYGHRSRVTAVAYFRRFLQRTGLATRQFAAMWRRK